MRSRLYFVFSESIQGRRVRLLCEPRASDERLWLCVPNVSYDGGLSL